MCIRDRRPHKVFQPSFDTSFEVVSFFFFAHLIDKRKGYSSCLLYTSDAADERSSVDLGGRRIIKKKNHKKKCKMRYIV